MLPHAARLPAHTPPPLPLPLLSICSQGVWRLSDSGLLRGEVEDLQVACESTLATANASLATMEERGGDVAGAQLRWVLLAPAGCEAQWRQCLLCMLSQVRPVLTHTTPPACWHQHACSHGSSLLRPSLPSPGSPRVQCGTAGA